MDVNQKLLAAFQVEHLEHLEGIRACLTKLEAEPATARGDLDEAFRRAHSLKGAARVTGLSAIEALSHALESLFSRVRSGALVLSGPAMVVVQRTLDSIEDLAAAVRNKQAPPDHTATLSLIERFLKGEEPGARSQESRVGQQPAAPPTPTKPAGPLHNPPVQPLETVRLSAGSLDRMIQSSGQLLTESLEQDLVTKDVRALQRRIEGLHQQCEEARRAANRDLHRIASNGRSLDPSHWLDPLLHELRALTKQARGVRVRQQRSAWSLRQLADTLQADASHLRMVPAESELQGLRKIARDLAQDLGREIELRTGGLEVRADRMVLQSLKDSVIHVLRNAVAHGIEPPAERRQSGKRPEGRIEVHLEAIGNRLSIEVRDDGRGLDYAQIAEVAVSRGLLSSDEAASLVPDELARLVFQPGFSTSAKVDEFSGRGMGLSVVAEAVGRLQGEVQLQQAEGGGTRLRITVPLSIATHQLLLVACGSQTFAVPTYAIQRLHRFKIKDVASIEGKASLSLDGQITHLAGLAQLLGLPESAAPAADDRLLVVLRSGAKRLAVVVDRFIAERDALLKPLGPPASRLPQYCGAMLLEDGAVCLVLNPLELVERYEPTPQLAFMQPAAPVQKKRQPTILVVDDSFTTRTLESSILQTRGYDVQVAVDGLEALARLRSQPIDLVITDVQMPKLDGFVHWLNSVCPLKTAIARPGERAAPGRIYVAPADRHLALFPAGLQVLDAAPVSSQRPSGTVLFRSLADTLGPAALGVLLTGMGDDGAVGLQEVRKAGGHTIAEHESTAVVYGMPAVAVRLSAACEVLPLDEIANRIKELVK